MIMKTAYKKILYILCLSFLSMQFAQGAICSPKEAEAADAIIDNLNSWTAVNQNFKQFKHCDDGSIAEGNSEAIGRLLVDKWDTLPVLAKLIKQNPSLKKFVLGHIDTTLNSNDLEKIQQLSLSNCPKDRELLCKDLNKAAKKALKSSI
jgi:hypothetical protein